MSVLIKGLAMPKHCWQCRFKDSDDLCILLDDDCMKIWGEQKKLPNCPLVELPDHGDLIDRDALLEHECYVPLPLGNLPVIYRSYVKGAPVVIPAERSEDA